MYNSFFSTADVDLAMKNLDAQTEQSNDILKIDGEQVNTLLQNMKFKNGFALSAYNSDLLITEYRNMKDTTNKRIHLIDDEIK